MGWLEKNLAGLAGALEQAAFAENTARRDGALQSLDPRAKILGLGAWIIAAVSVRSLPVVICLGLAGVALAILSRLPLHQTVGRVSLSVLAFTGVIALPALFLTPGPVAGHVPLLGWPVTTNGLRTAGLLLARAEACAILTLILTVSTPWTQVLKALRVLGVSTVLVVVLNMTCRYSFLLLYLALDFFVARRSRLIGPLDGAQRRQLVGGTAGVLLGKSLALSEEVYQAMQSRGFRGEVYTLDDFHWRRRDGAALAGFAVLGGLAIWLGAAR